MPPFFVFTCHNPLTFAHIQHTPGDRHSGRRPIGNGSRRRPATGSILTPTLPAPAEVLAFTFTHHSSPCAGRRAVLPQSTRLPAFSRHPRRRRIFRPGWYGAFRHSTPTPDRRSGISSFLLRRYFQQQARTAVWFDISSASRRLLPRRQASRQRRHGSRLQAITTPAHIFFDTPLLTALHAFCTCPLTLRPPPAPRLTQRQCAVAKIRISVVIFSLPPARRPTLLPARGGTPSRGRRRTRSCRRLRRRAPVLIYMNARHAHRLSRAHPPQVITALRLTAFSTLWTVCQPRNSVFRRTDRYPAQKVVKCAWQRQVLGGAGMMQKADVRVVA